MTGSPLTRSLVLLTTAIILAACTAGGRTDYVKGSDSGAASPPGTVQTVNAPGGPDSTAGVGRRTGAPSAAGDTNSAAGKGTIQSNDNTRSVPGAATGAAPKRP